MYNQSMLTQLSLLIVMNFLVNAYAGGAYSEKYSAILKNGKGKVVIVTCGNNWTQEAGYQYKTLISGGIKKKCDSTFSLKSKACGLEVTNVKSLTPTDDESADCYE